MKSLNKIDDRLVRVRRSAFGLVLSILVVTASMASGAPGDTITFRAEVPKQEWAGWKFDPQPNRPAQNPEQFEIITSDGKSPRTFSGKVVGPKSMDGVEVGLVSLVGIPWTNGDNYQWEKVAPDGSFSVTDARHLDADKAIAVRGPDTAWTFLRFNFASNHGAKNIVLNAAPSKNVTVTVSGPDMQNLSDFQVELFDAYSQVDDRGNWLNREWDGTYYSEKQKSVDAVLPVGEVALFIHHRGWAGFYQTIDTRAGDHFHFVLMPGGELKIRALDRNGKPKQGVGANWKNPAAPLSYWEVKTNESGEFLGRDLVPGTFIVNVPGFGLPLVKVAENSVTEVLLQDGKKPVTSTKKISLR